MYGNNGHRSNAVHVAWPFSTADSRAERLRLLLTPSNSRHCITLTHLQCNPAVVAWNTCSSHTKHAVKKNSNRGIWLKKYGVLGPKHLYHCNRLLTHMISWLIGYQYILKFSDLLVWNWYNSYLASYPGCVGGERWPGINCLCMRDHSQKTWESIYVWKLSVKSICTCPIYFHIIERYSCLPVELPSTPWMQRIIAVYTKPKMLPCGYQLVSVSQYAKMCCCLRAWL